ncbi:MAG TPA: PepSY-like domain-containing protein [Candidatus Barnesiella excrementigallinarum]|nr:PepSY-like domain-containing protein [Candidatus Barnesiella excrementigallinarum]
MKKLMILSAILMVFGITTACADNDKPIAVTQLPQKAQQFIKTHFSKEKVAFAKLERDFLETTYEVVFTNSTKLEFQKDGNWKEVDCKYSTVPTGIVPAQIAQYVTQNYPDTKIVKIDRDKRDYEVKLTNGLELTFDLKFNLIDIDD